MNKKETTFEEQMKQLQEAAAKVNQEGISLEDMMQSYRDGIGAAKQCLSILAVAEMEADRLSKELDAMMEENQQ